MPNKLHQSKTVARFVVIWGAALTLIVAVGFLDGKLTARWTTSEKLLRASNVLQELPDNLGAWESMPLEIPEQHLRIAGATGHLARVYKKTTHGESYQVTILCGPHGPISLHPPTVCFTAAGWRQVGSPSQFSYQRDSQQVASFWRCRFEKPGNLQSQQILTEWAWSKGEGWQASENPRFNYAGEAFLFKIYVTEQDDGNNETKHNQRTEFVEQLLQQIEQTVFAKLNSTNLNEDQ